MYRDPSSSWEGPCLSLGGVIMNIFSGRRFLDVICFGLLFLFTAPRLSFAQASEMESLRATVKDMQQQLEKALTVLIS